MSDFNNVNMGAMNVDVDGGVFGFTKEAAFSLNPEFWELWDDFPEILAGKIVQKFGVSATCKAYELTAHNHLAALGLEDTDTILENNEGSENTDFYKSIADWSGTASIATGDYVQPLSLNSFLYEALSSGITDGSSPAWPTTLSETVSDGDIIWECGNYAGELLTFSEMQEGDLFYVEAEGYNLSSVDTTIYNSDYTATFTVDSDFWLYEKDAQLVKNPDGNLSDNENINIIYKYTDYNYQQINYKPDDFNTQRSELRLHQTNPNTAKGTELFLWEAQGQGVDIDLPEAEGSALNMNWQGFENSNRNGRKLGYLKIET